MDLSNLTGLEKPLTKLIETFGEGLGVVGNATFKFDARKIKRIGEAEATAEKLKIIKLAEGQAEAMQVLDRASNRFALEQYNKQINLENVFVKSREELEDKDVSDVPVSKDWAVRFMNVAQDVSDEEMQELLAKILAGEVAQPETYSRRLLEVVKNLSSRELAEFAKYATYAQDGLILTGGKTSSAWVKEFGLEFKTFVELCEIGLINADGLSLVIESNGTLPIRESNLLINMQDKSEISLRVIKLTEPGKQIAQLIQKNMPSPTKINEYRTAIVSNIKELGGEVNIKATTLTQ